MVAVDDRVSIELSSMNFTITDNIKKINSVKECTISGNVLRIVSNKQSKNLGRIIDCISDADSEILSLNIERPSLENVFLTLTGRSLRD